MTLAADMIPATDVAIRIEPVCENNAQPGHRRHQRRVGGVLLEMAPGPDGQPWYLCPACWLDGMTGGTTGAAAAVVEPEGKKKRG